MKNQTPIILAALSSGLALTSAIQRPYVARHEILDDTDAKQGLFAVCFTAGNPAAEGAFGFFAGPYLTNWALAKDFTLQG